MTLPDHPRVLIAEDDDEVRHWIDGTLTRAGYATTSVASGTDALALLAEAWPRPHLMVLDLDMPGGGGMAVLAHAGDGGAAAVPAIVVSGYADVERRVAALEAGAVDFVVKPIDARELVARIRTHLRVSALAAQWREGADRDPLTGLLNRRGFLGRLGDEIQRAARSDAPLAVAFIDLDHFKGVNDRLGHVAGDHLLRRVAGALDECLGGASFRGSILGRWGGDEFVVAVPDADGARIDGMAELLQGTLHRRLAPEPVGASLGVAWLRPREVTGIPPDLLPMALIEAADRAMYDHKAARSGSHRLP